MKRYGLLLLLMGGMICNSASSIDNLRIPDLRTLSIGGGGVTETPLYNPALLANLTNHRLFANYYNRYSVSELATVSGGFYFVNDILPTGFEITSFGYDAYRESLFRLSMGKRVAEKWTIGVSVQYMLLQSELFAESSGRVSADLGITFQPVENVLTGLSILHLPSVKVGDENIDNKHITYYMMQMGFDWQVVNTVLITATAEYCEVDKVASSFGMEYIPAENFRIRAGLRTTPFKPSFGVGYQLGDIQLDVGALYHPVLGISMGLGISFSF